MPDRKKVIDGLVICLNFIDEQDCPESCPYFEKCQEYEWRVMFQPLMRDALDLLIKQETKTGHWIFESQRYEAWSHTCSECGKRMTTCMGTYASYCWNCGAKMTGGEEDA